MTLRLNTRLRQSLKLCVYKLYVSVGYKCFVNKSNSKNAKRWLNGSSNQCKFRKYKLAYTCAGSAKRTDKYRDVHATIRALQGRPNLEKGITV